MNKNTSYWLPKNSQAWQQALDSVSSLLPTNIHSTDHDALYSLPIFALIVVLPTVPHISEQLSDKLQQHVHQYIQSWVDTQSNWQLLTVAEDSNANFVSVQPASQLNDAISPVQVYRYLLVPTSPTLMHPEKKSAAAHIIDDQITTQLRQDLTQLCQQSQTDTQINPENMIDCHVLSASHMLRTHKLACFDMDSTLIEQEVIVELAKKAGIGEEVSAITESAMRGEIDFDESFARRVALLQGISTDVLDEICEQLTLSSGAMVTISALKALGYHTVLLSGGFVYFANYIAKKLGIDEVHANILDIEDGEVTGEIQLPIVNGQKKAELVKHIAKRLDIDMTQVVCVGDGANDLPMMALADVGVAYQAKPIVQARADTAVNITGLDGVFYALGYPAISKQAPKA